ncbi:MAG: c-type cytochrome [Acidimicrobiia bacterium]|nr:c-type cytochrome [Acidimicrobiia bacterium]
MRARSAAAATGLALSAAGFVAAGGVGSSGSSSPLIEGADLFVAKGYAACHDGPDTQSAVDVGPPLADAAAWAGARRPDMDAESYLAESMTDPTAFTSPTRTHDDLMPVLNLDEGEVDRLIDYLLDG